MGFSIRLFDRNIPIIAHSANTFAEIESEIKDKGIDDYIAKPFNPETLKEKLSYWIKKSLT